MDETTVGELGVFTKQQMWMVNNILNLLENQKSELTILTRRVTDLEIENLKNLRQWENQKTENVERKLFESEGQKES